MSERCATCHYWRNKQDTWAKSGLCKRFPPSNSADARPEWKQPITVHDQWCGEYKPAQAAPEATPVAP